MDDVEMEEAELEETEDLLEYYLQRAANTQSEAERLLAGARDLEESIGVSLSARRFEVSLRPLQCPYLWQRIASSRCTLSYGRGTDPDPDDLHSMSMLDTCLARLQYSKTVLPAVSCLL